MGKGRFAHVLKGNKSGSFPTSVVLFDTETKVVSKTSKSESISLRLGWACLTDYDKRYQGGYRREWFYFEDEVKFYEWLVSKCRKKRILYVMSANIWFDIRVSKLINNLLNNKWVCSSFWVRGLAQGFAWECDGLKISCLNFQNWMPFSVKAIGKTVGLEKLDVDFKRVGKRKLSIYCKRDVEIIVKAWDGWRSFNKDNDLGVFGKTLPAQAFNSYRHRFMNYAIYIHNQNDVMKLERAGYYGGRTECFYIGKRTREKVYKLDINSFYPYVMSEYHYPVKLIKSQNRMSIKRLTRIVKKYCVVMRARVKTDKPAYVVKMNKKTVYPIGEFDCYLTTPSVKFALKHNHILKVYKIAWYERQKIFTDYVKSFYALRAGYKKKDNSVYEKLSKLFLNSLYGKFGQVTFEIVHIEDIEPDICEVEDVIDIDTNERYQVVSFGGKRFWIAASKREALNSFVAISSHVTDYARINLYKYMEKAGRKNVYYCDTDSLFVNEQGYRKMKPYLNETKLGSFKLEATANKLTVNGLKDYVFGNKVTLKGIRKNAIKTGKVSFQQVVFPSFNGEVRKGVDKPYEIRQMVKTLKRTYDKGIVTPNGYVLPFSL